jgi:hypothetical protein
VQPKALPCPQLKALRPNRTLFGQNHFYGAVCLLAAPLLHYNKAVIQGAILPGIGIIHEEVVASAPLRRELPYALPALKVSTALYAITKDILLLSYIPLYADPFGTEAPLKTFYDRSQGHASQRRRRYLTTQRRRKSITRIGQRWTRLGIMDSPHIP